MARVVFGGDMDTESVCLKYLNQREFSDRKIRKAKKEIFILLDWINSKGILGDAEDETIGRIKFSLKEILSDLSKKPKKKW